MLKTKTCPRCNGTGLVSGPVIHLGVPGGCFQCNMKGVVRWATADDLNVGVDAGTVRYLAEIEGRAADQKARFNALSDKRKAKYAATLETSLTDLRLLWKQVKDGKHPSLKRHKRGKWIACR